MSIIAKLASFDDDIDFRRLWRIGLLVSILLVVASVAAIAIRGLNLGIDFEGGSRWDIPTADLSVAAARDELRPLGEAGAKIQTIGSGSSRVLRVQSPSTDEDRLAEVAVVLGEAADVPLSDIGISSVGPSWSDEITNKARNALIWFFAAITLYMAIRLEWKMAIAALVSVVHDIVITVGVYAALQLEITPATVVAFLTILGYSLYDTIVVFDRVQDNAGELTRAGRATYTGAVNLSLNQVLMRSINTTITSLLPVLAMLVVGSFILGAATLQEFSFALAIGLALGAYSSIFVASPVLALIKEREPEMAELRQRIAARTGPLVGEREVAPAVVGAAPPPRRKAAAAPTTSGRPIPPRPRKKGKRR
jgi:preprotein translocase subunit SecF